MSLLVVLLASAALLPSPGGGAPDGSSSGGCPDACTCKWKGGKPTVECVNASLRAVPRSLDGDTQVLDLSDNPGLGPVLGAGMFADRAGLPNLQKVYLAGCEVEEVEDHCFR